MIQRVLSFLIGVALLAIVVYLGIGSGKDNRLIVWFGLASALLAPVGLAAVSYTFTAGDRQILKRLSKVSDLDRLVKEAKTQEEKIGILKKEAKRLLSIAELEGRKRFLLMKKLSIEENASRLLSELENSEEEMKQLDVTIESSTFSEDVKKLHDKISVVHKEFFAVRLFGKRLRLDKATLLHMPFGGVIISYIMLVDAIMEPLMRYLRSKKRTV